MLECLNIAWIKCDVDMKFLQKSVAGYEVNGVCIFEDLKMYKKMLDDIRLIDQIGNVLSCTSSVKRLVLIIMCFS